MIFVQKQTGASIHISTWAALNKKQSRDNIVALFPSQKSLLSDPKYDQLEIRVSNRLFQLKPDNVTVKIKQAAQGSFMDMVKDFFKGKPLVIGKANLSSPNFIAELVKLADNALKKIPVKHI